MFECAVVKHREKKLTPLFLVTPKLAKTISLFLCRLLLRYFDIINWIFKLFPVSKHHDIRCKPIRLS